ncbi:hypothetical protein F2P81_005219 [Scophthalmus maximus]|uniref:Uncharacterized protein n=1 Tax=Scophthalmus maximus TaxID=52904 RepID=A0A6A4T5X2_SCOMX|nr:hypothetical protein F2P81_005219 [Scophthalmus maximus]
MRDERGDERGDERREERRDETRDERREEETRRRDEKKRRQRREERRGEERRDERRETRGGDEKKRREEETTETRGGDEMKRQETRGGEEDRRGKEQMRGRESRPDERRARLLVIDVEHAPHKRTEEEEEEDNLQNPPSSCDGAGLVELPQNIHLQKRLERRARPVLLRRDARPVYFLLRERIGNVFHNTAATSARDPSLFFTRGDTVTDFVCPRR